MSQLNLHETQIIRIATYASVAVAALLICLKLFAWWITHSVSLQASLIDSLLDGLASFINMIAVYQALKPPDAKHRFGHGKIESLAALGQSVFIGGSSIWLLYEAHERFTIHQPIEFAGFGIVVMGIAILITLILVSYQYYVVKRTQSPAIAADMLHYKSDLLINIATIVALASSQFFHIDELDPIFGLLIGCYILWTAWRITTQAFNVLLDQELDDEHRKKILTIIKSHPEVIDVWDLRTRSSGVQQFFQLHLLMRPDLTLRKADEIADEVEAEIAKAYPRSQVIIRLVPEILGDRKHEPPLYL
jgi:ferrous-iron efflux pump FieF